MPNYCFHNEENDTYEDVFFKFQDAPRIGSYITYEGRKLRRIPTIPQTASDTTNIDPFSEKDFVKATNKNGTIGQIWETAREFSEKREKIAGKDIIKEKALDEQQKKTGRIPLERKRMEAKKKLEAKGIIVE